MRPLEAPAAAVPRDPRIHRDPISGRAVFVAPERADRPIDEPADATTGSLEACPFCAGNERLTPPDVLRVADDAGGWRARIIPNRYPIVRDLAETAGRPALPTRDGTLPAHGVHEVVVESPRHERSILAIAPDCWAEVWQLCRERLAMLSARHDLAWATIFKNSGPGAGASLEHVHSQLVAIDFVPAMIHSELAHAEASPDAFDTLLREADADGRIVETAGGLVALAPPAPRQPFETWIVPQHGGGSFASASDADAAAVARLSRSLIERLQRIVPNADYNWWLHQAPFNHVAKAPGYRWHVEIVPRLASLAGFELGTGCHITTLSPVESARRLAEV